MTRNLAATIMNNLKKKLFYSLSVSQIILSFFIAFSILIQTSISQKAFAQKVNGVHAEIELQTIGTTNGVVPFWLRSNQFGSIPLSGFSQSFIGRINREYKSQKETDTSINKMKLIDWGFGLEARGNAGNSINGQIIEAYGKARLSIFQLKIGRTKDVMGLNGDTTLSSGNFAVSGNALGIPKVEISVPEYWRIPIFDGLFSFKGNFLHGWVGQTRILDSIPSLPPNKEVFYINDNTPKTYLHQKSLYVKLGKEHWKLNLFGGFSHNVYWGNEKEAYGDNFKLSPAETFFYVATGKAYGTKGVPTSKIGNQLGSIDLGADYKFSKINIFVYRQFFYDVGALSKLANVADGLTGVTITNKNLKPTRGGFQWKKFLLEYFYSKNQAGYPWSTPTKSGDEDYYNNFYYRQGWSYDKMGLGNPLITPLSNAKSGQISREIEYFINNRVVAVHMGAMFKINEWDIQGKATYSRNYGTFGTSIYGNSTGEIRTQPISTPFVPVTQISLYLDAMKPLKNNYSVGFSAAIDKGNLLNNSIGALIKLKKAL
jgi:hypothetical protein